ncbi:hypothetical protein [Streptomyces sp. NPDC059906]|uniref:hypothetical protein n=1 Tax=Streptomyces sp. NPDC059906 TaxID=3346997 RepID=UPI003664768E
MPRASIPDTPALGGSRWHTFPAAGTTLTAREFLATGRGAPVASEPPAPWSGEAPSAFDLPPDWGAGDNVPRAMLDESGTDSGADSNSEHA